MTHNLAVIPRQTGQPPTLPFARLLRIEWRKSTDTRAARWMLVLVAIFCFGAMLVPLFLPGEFEQGWLSYLAPAALVLAILLPIVSILTLTSEWSQRSVLVTFTQEPRRTRVLAAKVLSGLGLALVASGCALAAVASALAVSDALGRDVSWDLSIKYLIGFLVFVVLNSLLGMAFGALLLNTPAAIVLFLVLPTVWTLISFGWLRSVGEWLDTAQTFRFVLEAEWNGHTSQILTSIGVWVVLPLALGALRTIRREVS